jgi:glycosyltransferase involved in cell wall biosynthesis
VNVDGIEWERAKWGRVARKVFHTGAQFTARFATELVFDSHEIARRWADDFSRQGTYIPYGGDTSPHALPLVDGLEHRGYVLLVARFVPENTINEFFDAVPQLSEMADVVIVGSSGYGGELDARASELARRLDRVHWMGHLSDDRRLYSLWQHAGAYVHGHSVGGTNPALVQAMALGAPVVARDTVFNREVLGPDAAYFQPNADSIVKTVKSSFQDRSDIERRSHSHISRAEQNFSWEKINSDYASCLYAAIGRRLGETK